MNDIERARKDKRLLVLLDADERAMLERIAAAWGVSLAGAVRRMIREQAQRGAAIHPHG